MWWAAHEEGAPVPTAIERDTASLRERSDSIEAFIKEHFIVGAGEAVAAKTFQDALRNYIDTGDPGTPYDGRGSPKSQAYTPHVITGAMTQKRFIMTRGRRKAGDPGVGTHVDTYKGLKLRSSAEGVTAADPAMAGAQDACRDAQKYLAAARVLNDPAVIREAVAAEQRTRNAIDALKKQRAADAARAEIETLRHRVLDDIVNTDVAH